MTVYVPVKVDLGPGVDHFPPTVMVFVGLAHTDMVFEKGRITPTHFLVAHRARKDEINLKLSTLHTEDKLDTFKVGTL